MFERKVTAMIAAALLGATTGAMADDASPGEIQIHERVVRFGDLDLSKTEGVAALHWRLRIAAIQVCGEQGVGPGARHRRIKCRSDAIDRALMRMPGQLLAHHAAWKSDGANWLAKTVSPVHQRVAAAR